MNIEVPPTTLRRVTRPEGILEYDRANNHALASIILHNTIIPRIDAEGTVLTEDDFVEWCVVAGQTFIEVQVT